MLSSLLKGRTRGWKTIRSSLFIFHRTCQSHTSSLVWRGIVLAQSASTLPGVVELCGEQKPSNLWWYIAYAPRGAAPIPLRSCLKGAGSKVAMVKCFFSTGLAAALSWEKGAVSCLLWTPLDLLLLCTLDTC